MLQSFVESLHLPEYPLDLEDFSEKIKLYDYQQKALENVYKLLFYYYQEIKGDKSKLWEEYKKRGFEEEWTVRSEILKEYFRKEELTYKTFVNRASFWMATGSGKTVVIVKLIELLDYLMREGIIPERDILFLTQRDDLILSFKKHVEEYNKGRAKKILLEELKNFNQRKANPQLYDRDNILVFYYRSDLISDRRGDKILDYRYYYNNGNWYLILDEAHKGDNEESKRKQIFMVFTKNGFMFNFSATFTDIFDRVSTVYRFNLADFVRQGYGKHIAVMETQTKAFKNKNAEYTDEEKKGIIIKLLLLTGFLRKIKDDRYPSPLAVALVNTVNTEEADLKLFLRELFSIAERGIDENTFLRLRNELISELREIEFWVEKDKLRESEVEKLREFTPKDLYQHFFSSAGPSEVEIVYHPDNRQELVFKLRSGDRPFALIKIVDIMSWLKSISEGFVINETFEKEKYFLNIDERDSISLLAGSRSFYEGWDSPRPNVIMFINIGSKDAQKFILQSVGRGVRVKIIGGNREYRKRQDFIRCLETLYIFATSRKAVLSVIDETLRNESEEEWEKLEVAEKNPDIAGKTLLIPVYRYSDRRIEKRLKFYAGEEDIKEVMSLTKNIENDAVLCLLTGRDLRTVKEMKQTLSDPEGVIRISGRKMFKSPLNLLNRFGDFISAVYPEVNSFVDVDDKIKHYKHIEVNIKKLTNIEELKNAIKDSFSNTYARIFLESKYGISAEWFEKHFYLPVLKVADGISAGAVDWIRRIIKHESEVKFIKDLIENSSCLDEISDWWMFSRIDEVVDKEIYIPYYKYGKQYRWYPDFVLWVEKNDNYFIIFVDPKGKTYTNYQAKIDFARKLFETEHGIPKVFEFCGKKIRILTFLYNRSPEDVPEPYKDYWVRNIRDICKRISLH